MGKYSNTNTKTKARRTVPWWKRKASLINALAPTHQLPPHDFGKTGHFYMYSNAKMSNNTPNPISMVPRKLDKRGSSAGKIQKNNNKPGARGLASKYLIGSGRKSIKKRRKSRK
jgi:hypothetical protein